VPSLFPDVLTSLCKSFIGLLSILVAEGTVPFFHSTCAHHGLSSVSMPDLDAAHNRAVILDKFPVPHWLAENVGSSKT
jgi:hypothetical protein